LDFGIDNVILDQAAVAVPEPSALLLFGSGLVIAVFRRRMKKRG
jgi:hypothetical protein